MDAFCIVLPFRRADRPQRCTSGNEHVQFLLKQPCRAVFHQVTQASPFRPCFIQPVLPGRNVGAGKPEMTQFMRHQANHPIGMFLDLRTIFRQNPRVKRPLPTLESAGILIVGNIQRYHFSLRQLPRAIGCLIFHQNLFNFLDHAGNDFRFIRIEIDKLHCGIFLRQFAFRLIDHDIAGIPGQP